MEPVMLFNIKKRNQETLPVLPWRLVEVTMHDAIWMEYDDDVRFGSCLFMIANMKTVVQNGRA